MKSIHAQSRRSPHGTRVLSAISLAALLAVTGAAQLLAELPQTRTISLRNIHTDETITVEYKKNGRLVPEAMERINWVMRDWRKNEKTTMEPALIDLLWEMHTELGSKKPIDVICGYRSRGTNEMLRKTVGGQASESRHILGKAADVQFPDVALKQLRYSAMVRERGGVGYYPTSGTPFVHVDTDRVRAWPRLPRFELALLFPNGHSKHLPAEGGEISAADVKTAQSRYRDLAVQVAEFHDMRKGGQLHTTLVADAGGLPSFIRPQPARQPEPRQQTAELKVAALPATPTPIKAVLPPAPVQVVRERAPALAVAALQAPKLVTEPRVVVDRPARLLPRPSEEDRSKLAQLAALAAMPELVAGPQPAVRARRPDASTVLHSLTGALPATAPLLEKTAAVEHNPRLAFASASASDALMGWSSGFAPAPEFDDDHPEEISYRPFPVAPYLTVTASADDSALTQFVHPDIGRAIDLNDQTGTVPPMRLRPAPKMAQMMWAQQFSGEPEQILATDAPSGLAERKVRTEAER